MNIYIFWDNTLSNSLPISIISHGLKRAILYYIARDSRTLEQLKDIYGESTKYNELQLKFIDLFDRLNSEDMLIFTIDPKSHEILVDPESHEIYTPLKNLSDQALITMNTVKFREEIGLNQEDLK